jgi:hypothetical protein
MSLNKPEEQPPDNVPERQNAFYGFRQGLLDAREVIQDVSAQRVQRTRQTTSKIRADFVTGHACHRAELAQEVMNLLELLAASSALKPIAFAIALYCPEKSPTPRRIAMRVFSSMPSICAYWLAVIWHAAELLADTRKDSGHVAHVTASVTGLYAQAIQEAFRAGIVTDKTGEAFQR